MDARRLFNGCTMVFVSWLLSEARRLMENAVKRYDFENNIIAVSPNSYNETLTVFWLSVVNDYLKRNKTKYLFTDLANNLVEHFSDRDLPLKYYTSQQLFSPIAKVKWLTPDKQKVNKFGNQNQ